MATNKEWLFGLPLDEQIAWMNREHAEDGNGTLEAISRPVECQPMRDLMDELDELESQCNALARDLGECMAERDQAELAYNELRGKVLDLSDTLYHIASCDGGVA